MLRLFCLSPPTCSYRQASNAVRQIIFDPGANGFVLPLFDQPTFGDGTHGLPCGNLQNRGCALAHIRFGMDWRRDNRAHARRLQRFVQHQLPRWRDWSGARDAQVILVAHSMGGLISRYYLEVLGGWHDCRALFTIGTPHRGSVNALDTLSNGVRKLVVDLSQVVRSFPSTYQLLPTYPVVEIDGSFKRVGETNKLPHIDQERAIAAREQFHEAIRHASLRNRRDSQYRQCTIPWVGTRQDTYQSALLSNGKLSASYHPPSGLDPMLADGDGTVPRVSAVPPDLDGQRSERFAVEQHGWLMNNEMALEPLLDTLVQLVAVGTQDRA